jgi:hypothetical protein
MNLLEIEGEKHGRAVAGSAAAKATARHLIRRERATPAMTYALERLKNAVLNIVGAEISAPRHTDPVPPRVTDLSAVQLTVRIPEANVSNDWGVLGSFALAEHLARFDPSAPTGAWRPSDIDLFFESQGTTNGNSHTLDLYACAAVALWRDLGLKVSVPSKGRRFGVALDSLPVQDGLVGVRAALAGCFETEEDMYGEYGFTEDKTCTVFDLELLPPRLAKPPPWTPPQGIPPHFKETGVKGLADRLSAASLSETPTGPNENLAPTRLLPKLSFISVVDRSGSRSATALFRQARQYAGDEEGPGSRSHRDDRFMASISGRFDIDISKFGMRPCPGGGSAWELWSPDGVVAESATRGVMHLCPRGVTRIDATLARIEKYRVRGFLLASDGSPEQRRFFEKRLRGFFRLSDTATAPGHQEFDVIVDEGKLRKKISTRVQQNSEDFLY